MRVRVSTQGVRKSVKSDTHELGDLRKVSTLFVRYSPMRSPPQRCLRSSVLTVYFNRVTMDTLIPVRDPPQGPYVCYRNAFLCVGPACAIAPLLVFATTVSDCPPRVRDLGDTSPTHVDESTRPNRTRTTSTGHVLHEVFQHYPLVRRR